MSDENDNTQLVLICGESGSGKSASLMNLPDHERVMYLNCESGKRLPFKNKFQAAKVTDPLQVPDAFDFANGNEDIDYIVVDTITFLMEMFESHYIVGSTNTMQGWSEYFQYFKQLMQDKVANSDKRCIFLAHTLSVYDEKTQGFITSVPIKGALKNNGIEAYFSTVVSTKKVELKVLADYENDLLNITDRDRTLGYKHVFQTQPTKTTTGERIRSPMGMFTVAQTYIDNDAALLMDHLAEYYG